MIVIPRGLELGQQSAAVLGVRGHIRFMSRAPSSYSGDDEFKEILVGIQIKCPRYVYRRVKFIDPQEISEESLWSQLRVWSVSQQWGQLC